MTTCVDRGGTFTDVVIFRDDSTVTVLKIPSDQAVVGNIAEGDLIFGTTVATNALLERTGVKVLLLTTAGLEELVYLGDMSRPALFEPEVVRPAPMIQRVVGVQERISAQGEVVFPVVLPKDLDLSDIEAVAIVLLHGSANPAHEVALAQYIRRNSPGVHLAMGHQIDPDVGLLARLHTTIVDAAITPVLQRALERDNIPAGAQAMRSDGTLVAACDLRAPEAVLSGPAGGVLAVAEVARVGGFSRAVGLDMGGTSTDVCRVDDGSIGLRTGTVTVAGVPLRRPTLEVDTIAAGGGSILRNDGLRLTVGPDSAGAHPGPQCYGRGGPPTLTDAAVLAGLVDPAAFSPKLDEHQIHLPGDGAAFLTVAREAMAAAVRRLATASGVDLSDHALVAYGGAAGQHAAPVAERLGIQTVLIHPCAAVLSAWGQHLARRAERRTQPVWRPLIDVWPELPERTSTLIASMPSLGQTETRLNLRAPGTDHPLVVSWSPASTLEGTISAFHAVHLQQFGFRSDSDALELASLQAVVHASKPQPSAVESDPFGIGRATLAGPTLLRCATTSVLVPDGWTATRQDGLLRLERDGRPTIIPPQTRTPLGVSLWASRFMGVAERAGETLRRLARSVNIRERLDFSCAVFDESGHLVANAPHIPVHLGAMGETVRDILTVESALPDGQSWLTNDPQAGGSHLPDLTVVTAVRHGERVFFVACRAHHVDVGGLTPGSMPPFSASLAEEGVVLRRLPLLHGQRLRSDLAEALAGCRHPDTVIADLRAQLAANRQAAHDLKSLGSPDLIATWMAHLQDVADESVGRLLPNLVGGTATDTIDGLPLQVRIQPTTTGLLVDFSGTGGPHPGNLNAPRAVVRAAVMYALRVLCDHDIPLNAGVLRRVQLEVPAGSLLDPPPGRAVAGGNVEVSQRLVDLILAATGRMASSAGSMSNLTLGGEGWSFYETLAGGSGGSPRSAGVSARQAHMTNTRATDPEVLERRLPLRLRRFAVRPGSAGSGDHPGGHGLIREIEVLEPCTAAMLAAWRPNGAPGLNGAGCGAPGRAMIHQGGTWTPWNGAPVALAPGDAVRIETPGGGGYSPGLPGVQGESPQG